MKLPKLIAHGREWQLHEQKGEQHGVEVTFLSLSPEDRKLKEAMDRQQVSRRLQGCQ